MLYYLGVSKRYFDCHLIGVKDYWDCGTFGFQFSDYSFGKQLILRSVGVKLKVEFDLIFVQNDLQLYVSKFR